MTIDTAAVASISENLTTINNNLSPILSKSCDSKLMPLTIEEQIELRQNLLNLHAQVRLLAMEVPETPAAPKRRLLTRPFKK